MRLPDGPHAGQRWRQSFQPVHGLLFDEIDRDHWRSIVVPASTQSGKTFAAFTAPAAYWISELRENYVIGLPDMNLADDKWRIDLQPMFAASPRLRDLLPNRGPGSRGGTVKNSITFANGAILKFMSAGGADERRAAFTSRGLGITEAKAFSYATEGSHEGTQLDQIRGRLLAYKRHQRRECIEGTTSIESELPWSLRKDSSRSTLVVPCPHCERWIAPGREHLWFDESAKSEDQAAESAAYSCPKCGEEIDDDSRRSVVPDVRLLHDGQTIDKRGRIKGDAPNSRRLWFRWNCFLNLFQDAGDVAAVEWKRKQFDKDDPDGEEIEKVACQQFWAIPYKAPDRVFERINEGDLVKRESRDLPQGQLPDDTKFATTFVDVGMYRCYWVLIAWREGQLAHVADYQSFSVLARGEGDKHSRQHDVDIVLFQRLVEFGQRCLQGWPVVGRGEILVPERVWFDAGYKSEIVWSALRELNDWARFSAHLGRGVGQHNSQRYSHPKRKTNDVRLIGDRYYKTKHERHRYPYVVSDSDHWKAWLQRRLKVDVGPGSMSVFRDTTNNPPHKTFERHLRSESIEQEIHPKHGPVFVFRNKTGKVNHYLDAAYGACVAGHDAGFRLLPKIDTGKGGQLWGSLRRR